MKDGGRRKVAKEEKKKCDKPIFKCETHENMSLTDSLHVCTVNQRVCDVTRRFVK